jgi:outer membrane protein insertion porin family
MSRFVRKLITAVFFCVMLSGMAMAQEKPRVMILPFEINAEYDRNYLQTEILKILTDHIQKSGAEVISGKMPPGEKDSEIRSAGMRVGASYVIWGSSTWSGEDQYKITAKILEVDSTGPPRSFSSEGKGGENLLPLVQELSRNLASVIIKQDKVAEIRVIGNKRIETDAIKRKIKTEPGDVFIPDRLSKDLAGIYSMGYFDDIRVTAKNTEKGKVVEFHIQETPTIREILITGSDAYDDEEIKKEMTIKPGSNFNVFKIKREVRRIESMFKEKDYHNVVVTYKIEPLENNQANLQIIIEQGEEVLVQKIEFQGNKMFSNEELQDLKMKQPGIEGWFPFSWLLDDSELGEMDTTEEGFFSFITGSGELKPETLSNDTAKLNAFYRNHGFMDARIGEPEIDFRKDGIYIKIKINEGSRFKVGKIDITGDLILPKEELLAQLKIQNEEYVNSGLLRKDILTLTDIYADQGYFYADIYPRPDKDAEKLVADITFVIKKGKPVYFEKIIISGNTNTRDKVIRRELPVVEQELYSGSELKRGIRNLNRLDFFEDVKVDTLKGSADDRMILKINAEDKPTGTFTFGAGYSSQDNLFGNVSVSERNLFGRGQILQVSAEVSENSNQYTTSFTEPWLFDIPLSATLALYKTYNDYDDYDRDRIGGSAGLGYPVFDYTRLSFTYVYEINEINDPSEDATDIIKELVGEGKTLTSKEITKLHFDTRDKVINTSEGWDNSLTVTYAGDVLGGDVAFIKYVLEAGYYLPLFWGTVGHAHTEGGYIGKNGKGWLPSYERFYLGGLNSLRGYDWRDVGPKRFNSLGNLSEVGGNKYVQFNLEYIFPLVKKAGLMGLVFYDMGNAFEDDLSDEYPDDGVDDIDDSFDLTNLRSSVGYGIRWYSPLGPLRLEYGHVLDRREGEKSGRWEFTMGTGF